jgi:hypothetical protein
VGVAGDDDAADVDAEAGFTLHTSMVSEADRWQSTIQAVVYQPRRT